MSLFKDFKGSLKIVIAIFGISLLGAVLIFLIESISLFLAMPMEPKNEYVYAFLGGIMPWMIIIAYAGFKKQSVHLIIGDPTCSEEATCPKSTSCEYYDDDGVICNEGDHEACPHFHRSNQKVHKNEP